MCSPELSCNLGVVAGSHVTMHYRLSLLDPQRDVINTFGGGPATLLIGLGQLAEPLERCLVGLHEGQQAVFILEPEKAFGHWNPDALQTFPFSVLDLNLQEKVPEKIGDFLEFSDAQGRCFTGRIKSFLENAVVVDFNHPLAGKSVEFEIMIISVL